MKIINISVIKEMPDEEGYTIFGLGDDGVPYAWSGGEWVAVA